MAIDFNGTTSKLEHTTASGLDVNTLTILVWALADGQGEGGFGRIFGFPETGAIVNSFHHDNVNNQLVFGYDFDTTDGFWTFPATDGQWNAVALSYDRTSTANDPVVRVNFASATVTEAVTPAGTAVSPATGYCVGNRSDQARTWNGALAHLQFFNVILTANEMDMGLRRPGSVTRGRVLWLPMYHSGHVQDWSGSALNGTATALGTRDGPPCQAPWASDSFGWRGAFTGVAVGADTILRPWQQNAQMGALMSM